MNISGFNAIGMDAATISKLFAPISADEIAASNSSAVTPSVSSADSSANVTSAAIAAIQALVKGGTAPASANASAAAQDSQSLPDWYTATGTTTFTPLNSTKPVTMATDAYLWYKDTGTPQTLDEVKSQFYQTNTVDSINSMIDQYKSIEAQAAATGDKQQLSEDKDQLSRYSSLLNAVKSGTVQFSLLDPSVSYQHTDTVIRDGGGHIIGNGGGPMDTIDWTAFNKVYNNNNKYYAPSANLFINGYVISWSKT